MDNQPNDKRVGMDACTAGLYRLAKECGWSEAQSRPPAEFIRGRIRQLEREFSSSEEARKLTVMMKDQLAARLTETERELATLKEKYAYMVKRAAELEAERVAPGHVEPKECPACSGNGYTAGDSETDKVPCGVCAETGKVLPYTPPSHDGAREAVPVEEIEAEIKHIERNGIEVAKFGGEHIDEGRCRELCAMYLREFIVSLRMQQKLDALAPSHDGQSGLTFDAFRRANVTRCLKWHPAGIESWSPSDWLTAVTGELGELASLLKMRNRERDGLPGNKFSPSDKQVADELADVLTYLDLLAAALGVDLGAAAVEKFNEVSKRVGFPDRIELTEEICR